MTREHVAAAVLAADQFGLLALYRHVPEASLTELIRRSQKIGDPVRLSLFHLAACERCEPALLVGADGDEGLCLRGRRVLAEARGWRPRPESA